MACGNGAAPKALTSHNCARRFDHRWVWLEVLKGTKSLCLLRCANKHHESIGMSIPIELL
jgi:hypothetical protein